MPKERPYENVPLAKALHAKLKARKDRTGVNIVRMVNEAVSQWLKSGNPNKDR